MTEIYRLADVIQTMKRHQKKAMLQDAIMNMVERNDTYEIARFIDQQFDGDAMQVVTDYAESKSK
jgi:hypothetical protein